jgi:hypothetical protein
VQSLSSSALARRLRAGFSDGAFEIKAYKALSAFEQLIRSASVDNVSGTIAAQLFSGRKI